MSEVLVEKVYKKYGLTEVLHGIDLEIPKGQLTVLLGPSGCGKSTLLRMIAGLEDISGGTIRIAGRKVNDIDPSNRGCAMVFQNYALYPHQTVRKNLAFPLKMAGVPKSEIERQVQATAAVLHIDMLLDRLPRDLSGGQRQRVAMGRAMIRNPDVFLFDEPLSNLDAELRVKMRLEISRLQADLNATVVFVTHDQVEAMTLAHRIVVMRDGHIEQAGTPLEVYNAPQTKFVAGFLGSPAMNFLPVGDVSQDGGQSKVTLTDGTILVSPILVPQATRTIGIRPQALSAGRHADQIQIDLKQANELGVEHLGDRAFRYVSAPFGELSLLVEEPAGAGSQSDLAMSVHAKDMQFFDADDRAVEAAG
ncbi:MAG: sn-glycerol-3-phosphate ABC transporter ATP-binding protein UgpC [Hyphomicrobiales bacterium]|jgi:ABC-type sugar transport system ATPase subunit